jgi:hypothetical protein
MTRAIGLCDDYTASDVCRLATRSKDANQSRRLLAIAGIYNGMSQAEARIGQKNGLAWLWTRKGTRPRQPKDQRYDSALLFGAICPAHGTGAGLVMPVADTEAMQAHLEVISGQVAQSAVAVLLLDRTD